MQKDFSKQLIKGKIAEMVFDQMFREAGKYTVIPFGYESIVPELMQYTKQTEYKALLENIRNAPDFALVSHNPKEVFLVEIKYRSKIDLEEIKRSADDICERWKLAWLFVATPDGFYFDACTDIVESGRMTPLTHEYMDKDLQEKYVALLKEFIR